MQSTATRRTSTFRTTFAVCNNSEFRQRQSSEPRSPLFASSLHLSCNFLLFARVLKYKEISRTTSDVSMSICSVSSRVWHYLTTARDHMSSGSGVVPGIDTPPSNFGMEQKCDHVSTGTSSTLVITMEPRALCVRLESALIERCAGTRAKGALETGKRDVDAADVSPGDFSTVQCVGSASEIPSESREKPLSSSSFFPFPFVRKSANRGACNFPRLPPRDALEPRISLESRQNVENASPEIVRQNGQTLSFAASLFIPHASRR